MATSIDLAVDTSALTAILLGEPEATALLRALMATPRIGLCAPNRTELLVVIQARLGDLGVERAKQFLALEKVQTIPLDDALADLAAEGYRCFGKGQHPAGLDSGDCFSYALAVREQVPLLFKGNDFAKTDARAAAWSRPRSPRRCADHVRFAIGVAERSWLRYSWPRGPWPPMWRRR